MGTVLIMRNNKYSIIGFLRSARLQCKSFNEREIFTEHQDHDNKTSAISGGVAPITSSHVAKNTQSKHPYLPNTTNQQAPWLAGFKA